MTTTPKDFQHLPPVSDHVNIPGVPNVVISLMTGSLLITLMGTRFLSEALTQLGLASEELFRGERLPNLQNMPQRSEPDLMVDADIE